MAKESMQTGQIEMTEENTTALSASDSDRIQNADLSFIDLLTILAKRKLMIGRTIVVVALASTIVAFVLPSRYTATTTLLPPQQPQSLTTALASQLGGIGMLGAVAGKDLGLKNPNDTYIGMLKSRVVADSLIQRFELMKVYRDKRLSDARKDLQDASEIESRKDGFITVSFEDKDPRRAAEVANAYVEELKRLTSTLAVTEAGQRRLFFEQQLQKAKSDLASAEVALKNTQQKTGLIQLDSQAKAIIESVAAVRAQIAAKEVQLQAMQSFATDQNPDVVLLRQELGGLRGQLARMETPKIAREGDIQVPTGQVPEVGLEYVRRLRDVKYYETIFELLAKQFEIAKLDEARQGAVIQVVDPAVPPDRRSFPNRPLIVILSVVVALVGAVLWAFFSEGISRMNADPDGASQLSALRQLFSSKG